MTLKTLARNLSYLSLTTLLSLSPSYAQKETPQNKVELLKEYVLENNQQSEETADGVIASLDHFRVGDYLFDLSVKNNSLKVNYKKNISIYVDETVLLVDNNFDETIDEGFSSTIETNYRNEVVSKEEIQFNQENKELFQQKYQLLVNTLLDVFEKRKSVAAINANIDSSISEKSKKVARYVRLLGEDNGGGYEFSFEKEEKKYSIRGFFDRDLSLIDIVELPFNSNRVDRESVSATDRYLDGISDAGDFYEKISEYSYNRTKHFNEFRNEGLEQKEFFQSEYERLLEVVLNRFAALKLNEFNICKLKKNQH
ncbi:hypothetical protein HY837_04180 [archaeon]|nr:hypothetical protein [archaeon]